MTKAASIREHMDVIGSCGNRLGSVDRIEGTSIKLAKNDPEAAGQHHWLPVDWVDHVDQHVHLSKNCGEAKKEWKTSAPTGSAV